MATVPFLSEAWIAALGEAAARVAVDPSLDLVIQHEIDGDGAYWLALRAGTAAFGPGRRDDATVTYRVRREVARAVATGERTPAEAFMAGELKVGGQVGDLLVAAAALSEIAAATAAVGERTDFS